MFLEKLYLNNFKNYIEAEFSFTEKINCFVGNNGAGKTNLLDALYYLSFCKSYFNPIDSQNIRHDENYFMAQGIYRKNSGSSDNIQCIVRKNQKKQFKLNKKEYDRLADHIGYFPLVIITPADTDLINNGSEERRKFLDGIISQFDAAYLNDILDYNKVLFQRNALLKRFAENNYFDEAALEIWDMQIIKLGQKIFLKRNEFIVNFTPYFQKYFEFVTSEKEHVTITYESHLKTDNLKDLLKASIKKDRILKYTTSGVHKDDLNFLINDYPIKKFGSQGQQKSFIVSVKLAQFDYIKKVKGFKPVLLLDDIFDKLDINRIQQLMKLVADNNFGQIFITDTSGDRIKLIFNEISASYSIFEINNGIVQSL
ncbi:MAG: DNA replication/repair protein RecF [Saprospiraceae bacterium]|nr:DNA replication/repair protein RecF [Saprospiraceae bacterium]